MKVKYLSIVYAGLFITSSCGTTSSNSEQASAEKKEEIESFVEKEFTYPLPTSFEVSQMLGNASTSYSDEIVNSVEKVDEYVATWQKSC